MPLSNYFEKFDYYRSRGKGIALYGCNDNSAKILFDELKKTDLKSLFITSGNIDPEKNDENINFHDIKYLFFGQDKDIGHLSGIIEIVINRYIFPAFFRGIPIFFCSRLTQPAYIPDMKSGDIHSNYQHVINNLLVEQLDQIIKQSCIIYQDSDLNIDTKISQFLTPIEEIMREALDEAQISYKSQAKIGNYLADFLVESNDRKFVVECDGRDYHNPYRDKIRDTHISEMGYNTLRFTGSEIWSDINSCIAKIQNYHPKIGSINLPVEDLDESQRQALNHFSGPIRVLAPAGSGKTRTLTNRIINLINNGIDPNKIMALAFNKRAAEEMRTRISELTKQQLPVSKRLGEDGVVIHTFHSFGYQIINSKLGWRFDANKENTNTRRYLKQAVDQHYKIPRRRNKDPLDVFLDALRRTKMELPPLIDVFVEDEDKVIPFKDIFLSYQKIQTQHNFFSFDDMIYLADRILIDDMALRMELQNKYEYILIDEFQDLNKAQILMMQILSLPQNNIFVVGDDDQMIYGWRGAEVTHILKFNERYVDSKDCTLSTNYRSSRRIVNHSKWLINHNQARVKKNIKPNRLEPGYFEIKLCPALWHQAVKIAEWLKKQNEKGDIKWHQYAILFRYNTYQYILAMILDSYEIPHTPVDSARLFKTNVGRDIFSYLRILLYPDDSKPEDYSRVLKRPNYSLPNDLINRIHSWTQLISSPKSSDLEQWQRNKLQNISAKFLSAKSKLSEIQSKAPEFLLFLGKEFGLSDFYKDNAKRSLDLDEAGEEVLFEVTVAYAKEFNTIGEFYGFLNKTIHEENNGEEPEQDIKDKVILTTIHRTKGNEYKSVAYFNLAKNERIKEQSEKEEERRVTYVGITRAIENILITAPKESYSDFLKETAFNPDFKELDEITLNLKLSSQKLKYESHLRDKKNKEEKISKLKLKYPELTGADYKIQGKSLRKVMIWLRTKSISRAEKKLRKMEQSKAELINMRLLPCEDLIQKIKIELHFREIFTPEP